MLPRALRVLLVAMAAAIAFGAAAGVIWGMRHRAAATDPPTAQEATTPANVVDAATHDQLLALESRHPGAALLEFHASWCQPCHELAPRVEALARAHPELLVVRIDASSGDSPLANEFGAETLPLLVKMSGGKETDRRIGAATAAELERWALASGSTADAAH
jgi:thiol-disulfide isomerase/thioredoxin